MIFGSLVKKEKKKKERTFQEYLIVNNKCAK